MHNMYIYPRYSLAEKLLFGSAKLITQLSEWLLRKCLEKIHKFEEAFFDWEPDV